MQLWIPANKQKCKTEVPKCITNAAQKQQQSMTATAE
jgi:hypothetical protein